MARPTMATGLAALLSALAMTPAVSHADHLFDAGRMISVAEQLQCSSARFEQLACQRPFPRHQLHQIRMMSARARKLADGVKCDASWSRVNYQMVDMEGRIRRLENQLRYECAFNNDRLMRRQWEAVKCAFTAARRVFEECGRGGCGLPPARIAPPIPELVDPPPAHGDAAYRDSRGRETTAPPWLDALIAALRR